MAARANASPDQSSSENPKDNKAPQSATGVELDGNGNVHVDVWGKIDQELLARIATLCGTVESSFPKYGTLRAWIPLLKLEELAEAEQVASVRPAEKAALNSQSGSVSNRQNASSAAEEQNGQTQPPTLSEPKSPSGCHYHR